MSQSPSSTLSALAGAIQISIADAGQQGNVAITRCYSTSFFMRACVYVVSCTVLMLVGALFTVMAGAWPILLFAILQALILACVWAELELHADDHEFVIVDDDAVWVNAVHRREVQQWRFQRHWARAVWSAEGERLCVRSHGREVEIAAGATKDDKLAVYRHLGRLIGTARAPVSHA